MMKDEADEIMMRRTREVVVVFARHSSRIGTTVERQVKEDKAQKKWEAREDEEEAKVDEEKDSAAVKEKNIGTATGKQWQINLQTVLSPTSLRTPHSWTPTCAVALASASALCSARVLIAVVCY